MNIVLIHIGPVPLSDYFWDACTQARRFFDGDIHAIIPSEYITNPNIRKIGLIPASVEQLQQSALYKRFEIACSLTGFWNVTMGRLIILQIYMMEKRLLDVLHIENDVLIYSDPRKMIDKFRKVSSGGILLCPVGDYHLSAAYMYARNSVQLHNVNNKMIQWFEDGKINDPCLKPHGLSEMTLLCVLQAKYPRMIVSLPVCPAGRGSKFLDVFDSLFDGASAGQFIGGTQTDPPGWAGLHHWLGQHLLKKEYLFHLVKYNGNPQIPCLIDKSSGKVYRMNNLHIHSKKLKDYM